MKKSSLTQFVLTLFFGPLGLFYSSVAAAIGLLLALITVGMATGGIGAIAIWFISIFVGFSTVDKYNYLIDKEEQRHQELIQATRHAATAAQKSTTNTDNEATTNEQGTHVQSEKELTDEKISWLKRPF